MPKIVNKKQKRKEIAQAAINILAEKGFERTTIQEIADAAKIGKGTIYEYFKSKEEIIIHAGNTLFQNMYDYVDTAFINLENTRDKLHAITDSMTSMIDTMLNIFIVYIELWLVHLRTKRYKGSVLLLLVENLVETRKIISMLLTEGKKTNEIREDLDTESAAISLVASLDGIAMHYYLDKNFDVKEVCKHLINNFFEGISK